MSELDDALGDVLKGDVAEVIGVEDLMVEAFREIVRDEIKSQIRDTLDDNPELREQLRDAVGDYFEARVRQATAGMRMTRLGAQLGVELLPEHLQNEISAEVKDIVEDEVGRILAESL